MAAAAPSDDLTSPSHVLQAEVQEHAQSDQAPSAHSIAEPTSAYPRLEQSQSLPYSSFSAAVSTSSSPGRTSPTAAGTTVRRQSTQDRLNGILETARQRAETVSAQAQATAPATPNTTLARHATVRMDPLLRNQSAPGAFGPELSGGDGRLGDGRGSHQSARHLHYAASAGTYGTLGLGRPRSRKNADRDQQAAAWGVASRTVSRTASRTASWASRASQTQSRAASVSARARPAEPPWWRAWLSGFQSIELENKGSVARDHLALERTFLAWLRTSLAFASIGVAVTQLFRLNTATNSGDDATDERLRRIGLPLGSTFLGISVLVLFLGYHRFYQSQQWILKGKYSASRGTILLVTLVAFALMVASLVIVVVVQPSG